jgi:hypothetical protein
MSSSLWCFNLKRIPHRGIFPGGKSDAEGRAACDI